MAAAVAAAAARLPADRRQERRPRGLGCSVAALGRLLSRPLPAWILFNGVLVAWHVPALFDATLSSEAVHDFEHATFFVAGLLFWLQVSTRRRCGRASRSGCGRST